MISFFYTGRYSNNSRTQHTWISGEVHHLLAPPWIENTCICQFDYLRRVPMTLIFTVINRMNLHRGAIFVRM